MPYITKQTSERAVAVSDLAWPIDRQKATTLPTATLLAAVTGIVPLAYFLDRFFGGGWHAALAAAAIVGVLSVNGFLLVRC